MARHTASNATPAFFSGQIALANNVSYLWTGAQFGYYSFLPAPNWIYHFDLGYEYYLDANDGQGGIYFWDAASTDWLYTNTTNFPFPYSNDFTLNATVYYAPGSTAQHYSTNPRWIYNYKTGAWLQWGAFMPSSSPAQPLTVHRSGPLSIQATFALTVVAVASSNTACATAAIVDGTSQIVIFAAANAPAGCTATITVTGTPAGGGTANASAYVIVP